MNKFIFIILVLSFLIIESGSYMQTKAAELIEDNLVNSTLLNKTLTKPEINSEYNFENTDIVKIKLVIDSDIKSENDICEGEKIIFKTVEDVYYNNQLIIKKGTSVPAKIETIISPGMNGIPASIIIGNFQIENISKKQLVDTIEIYGQDRSLWVYPFKWLLTPLPPTGSFTNFIKGGHAKLSSKKELSIDYHPHW